MKIDKKPKLFALLAFSASICGTTNAADYGDGSANWGMPSAAISPSTDSTSFSPSRNDGHGVEDAIEDANADGGGKAKLATRTYYVYQEIPILSNVWLQGNGKTNSYLKRGSSMSADDHIIFAENQNRDHVRIDYLQIHGNNTNATIINNGYLGAGIYISSSSMENQRIRLTSMRIRKCGAGFLGGGILDFRIEACDIYENGSSNLHHNVYLRRMGRLLYSNSNMNQALRGTGFKIWGGATSSSSNENKNFRISGCKFGANYKNNLEMNGTGYCRVWNCELDDQIETSASYNAGALLDFGTVGSHYFDLINNKMEGNNKYGIRVENANRVNIEGNYSKNNGNSNYSITGSNNVDCDYNESL